MRISTPAVTVVALFSAMTPSAPAQEPPKELTGQLAALHEHVVRIMRANADSIWPGFRPETIPVVYVLTGSGSLLVNWRGAPPEEFAPVGALPGVAWRPVASRAAASTGTILAGRPTAQVVVERFNPGDLFGTTVHEAFHVFQRVVARPNGRFGSSENSFYVSQYPVFDVENEVGSALEGRALAAVLDAKTTADAGSAARWFVAAREARHRRLGPNLAEFESMVELNEGLAEYALVRALRLAAADAVFPWRSEAAREATRRVGRIDSLTADVSRSVRLRFYVTGPAQALLLDRISAGWKARLVAQNLTLTDAVAEASGYREAQRQLVDEVERRFDRPSIARSAAAGVTRLRGMRRAQVDSILSRPGVRILVTADSLRGRRIGACQFDPQNLLQVDSTILLHNRFLLACVGNALSAEFTTPVLQDQEAGTLTAVLPSDSLRIRIEGKEVVLRTGDRIRGATVEIASPVLTLRSAHAEVERTVDLLIVRPLAR